MMQISPAVYIWLYLSVLYILIFKCRGDIYGTVNVGDCIVSSVTNKTDISPQLITVTQNVASSTLPVYFLNTNNSVPILEDCLVLDDDVLVSCRISRNYTDGDTMVHFANVVVTAGSRAGLIPFSVVEQGRAVEVECSGETVTPTTNPPQFASNTSKGVSGNVVVKKSPTVSICDDVVIVPNALSSTNTGQIQLQLSEPVEDNDATVSCSITGITQEFVPIEEASDDNWMIIIFEDVYASINTTDLLMTYNINRSGSLVVVTCYAESQNDGTQFFKNTSLSAATVFILETGSVQLLPQISLVPTPTFTSFMVLNSPVGKEEVVFSCFLNAVNDSAQARTIAENPVCKTQDDRSTGATPTQCTPQPGGVVTCPPVNQPNTTYGSWLLDQSELIFTEGDYYKTITARLEPSSALYVGALVLTCCAAPHIYTSPRFTNASAGLLIMSNVNGYRPINWTEAGESTTKETLFPNVAYVELAPCPCDVIQGRCETDCCCDTDCTQDDLSTVTCTPGITGGDFTKTDEFSCFNVTLYTPDYWPYLCVQITNTPYLGLYYTTVPGLRDLASFNAHKTVFTDDRYTSYRDLGKRTLEYIGDDNNVRLYQNGYPVEQLYSSDVRGYLSLPQRTSGEGCVWNSPLKFQEDLESSCELTSHQALCAETSVLSARMYLQGTSSSYPACPDAPRVVSKFMSSHIAPTTARYYCTDDVSTYMVSNKTLDDVLNPNKPSLFMDEVNEDRDSSSSYRDSLSSHPRCTWDDGYSRPPVPTFDNETGQCNNVVLDVDYELYWRGGEIIDVGATLLLGAISLQDAQEQTEVETEIDFVSPPPITAPPTSTGRILTSTIFENETEIITNFTEIFETENGTLGVDVTTVAGNPITGDPITGNPTTMNPTVPPTTQTIPTTMNSTVPPTTQAIPTTMNPTVPPTTQAIPSILTENPERGDNPGLPVLAPTTSNLPGTTMSSTEPSQESKESQLQNQTSSPSVFIQYFTAKFIHLPEVKYDENTGHVINQGEQSKRSGNPGYIIGSRVLTGVAIYDYLPDYDCLANSTDYSECNTGINGTFVVVDDVEDNRLKVWAPGPGSLCSDATIMDIPFGEDLLSGCLLRLGLAELHNCTSLRTTLEGHLASLVPSNVIGKRGNAGTDVEDDWVPIFGFDAEPYDPDNNTSDSVTTSVPLTTRFPGQSYVQDPAPISIADQLSGVCHDMPTGVNIEILIADVGLNRDTIQQEILGARLKYTTSKLQLKCSAANGASCTTSNHLDNSTSSNNSSTPWVQSFLITSTVTFTRVPAQEPKPVISYHVGRDRSLCLQDVCWDNALYPFTRAFQGDDFPYSLAVTLITLFFSIGYIALTQPWLHFP